MKYLYTSKTESESDLLKLLGKSELLEFSVYHKWARKAPHLNCIFEIRAAKQNIFLLTDFVLLGSRKQGEIPDM